MKLKYQMRGLGIGIVVTALLMGVATKEGLPLSDAEIRAKALTLGMVESDSLKLTDIQNTTYPSNTTPEPADGESEEGGDVAENGATAPDQASGDENGESGGADPTNGTGDEGGPSEDASESGVGETDGMSEAADGETGVNHTEEPGNGTVVIHIEAGMSSYGASAVIADAGLVEDAAAFDRYLCEQGYSRKIADGTYEIPYDATEEEIAKIITKGR